jgi:hypothetical protein
MSGTHCMSVSIQCGHDTWGNEQRFLLAPLLCIALHCVALLALLVLLKYSNLSITCIANDPKDPSILLEFIAWISWISCIITRTTCIPQRPVNCLKYAVEDVQISRGMEVWSFVYENFLTLAFSIMQGEQCDDFDRWPISRLQELHTQAWRHAQVQGS